MLPENRDYKLCENAVRQFKQGEYEIIKISCFNEEETKMLKQIMQSEYPEIPVTFSHLVFNKNKS